MKALLILAVTALAIGLTWRMTKPGLGSVLVGAALIVGEAVACIAALIIFT